MSQAPALPELTTAVLDPETLARLFADLASTEVLAVTLKGSAAAHSGTQSTTLARAQSLLEAAEVLGVQVRYRHDEEEWCDTLLRTPEGVRVVRMMVSQNEVPT